MVISATNLNIYTNNSINANATLELQTEVTLAEGRLLSAAGMGLNNLIYNAAIIGNPSSNPQNTSILSPNQLAFYNTFVNVGYLVYQDTQTGYWDINWAPSGPEAMVKVYSFRTSMFPGTKVSSTISAIQAYFYNVIPVVITVGVYDSTINPSIFGGTSSVYYEFTIVANQGLDNTDHSANVTNFVIGQGLGYMLANCATFKVV